MKKSHIVIFILLTAVFLTNCKKGDDDPVFSFRTSKNRLTGDWRMTKGSASITFLGDSDGDNRSLVFDGSGFNLYETPSGGVPTIYIGAYILDISFKKDGALHLKKILPDRS